LKPAQAGLVYFEKGLIYESDLEVLPKRNEFLLNKYSF
jgi:hypothetical protein